MKSISLLTVGVCVVLISPACEHKKPIQQVPPRPVTAAQAVAKEVPLYLDEIGNCTAFETVLIQPQVSGPVVEIPFTDGADLKKGELLFKIDPQPFQAALDKAKAALEQDKAKHDYNVAQLKRSEELSRTKVTSPQDLDSARSISQASLAAVQADQATLLTAQINLNYCTILSPIDGRASKRSVDAGNIVTANTTPMLLIQRQDPIYVDFTIAENALPKVREFIAAGTLKVQASFSDDPTKKRIGRFDFLDSGVQQGSGTVRMRAVFENKDRLFWPGQFVKVRLLLDTIPNAVLIPSESLQIGNNGPFVFVIKDDKTVEMRPVKPGQRQGDLMGISEGLKPGETVVVSGQLTLAPGTSVTIQKQ